MSQNVFDAIAIPAFNYTQSRILSCSIAKTDFFVLLSNGKGTNGITGVARNFDWGGLNWKIVL